MWYPSLVKGHFSVCSPFSPPTAQTKFKHPGYILPNFGYQLHFAGPEVEDAVKSKEDVRAFLSGMYGWGVREGKNLMNVQKGFDLVRMKKEKVGTSPIVSEKETDHYVEQYMKHAENPMRGPLNWYRVHELNYKDEQEQGWGLEWRDGKKKFTFPTLTVVGKRDAALPPKMSEGMERWFEKGGAPGGMKRILIESNHWALWTHAKEVNGLIAQWLSDEFGIEGGNGAGTPRL